MKILVINSGSSSLKFQVIDSDTEQVLVRGVCERIGIDGRFTYKPHGGVAVSAAPVAMENHTQAVNVLMEALVDEKNGIIKIELVACKPVIVGQAGPIENYLKS